MKTPSTNTALAPLKKAKTPRGILPVNYRFQLFVDDELTYTSTAKSKTILGARLKGQLYTFGKLWVAYNSPQAGLAFFHNYKEFQSAMKSLTCADTLEALAL